VARGGWGLGPRSLRLSRGPRLLGRLLLRDGRKEESLSFKMSFPNSGSVRVLERWARAVVQFIVAEDLPP
jgi:hypothetical protein